MCIFLWFSIVTDFWLTDQLLVPSELDKMALVHLIYFRMADPSSLLRKCQIILQGLGELESKGAQTTTELLAEETKNPAPRRGSGWANLEQFEYQKGWELFSGRRLETSGEVTFRNQGLPENIGLYIKHLDTYLKSALYKEIVWIYWTAHFKKENLIAIKAEIADCKKKKRGMNKNK